MRNDISGSFLRTAAKKNALPRGKANSCLQTRPFGAQPEKGMESYDILPASLYRFKDSSWPIIRDGGAPVKLKDGAHSEAAAPIGADDLLFRMNGAAFAFMGCVGEKCCESIRMETLF